MRIFWQPNPDDTGDVPSDLVYSTPWRTFGLTVGTNPLYSEPLALRIQATDSAGAGTLWERAFIISSIYGIDVSNLSFPISVYIEYNTVGVNTDGGVIVTSNPSLSVENARAAHLMTSRNTSDFILAAREYVGGFTRVAVGGVSPSSVLSRNLTMRAIDAIVTPETISVKAWDLGETEPSSPQLEIENTFTLTSGSVGFMRTRAPSTENFTLDVFKFGVSDDGLAAPREPVPLTQMRRRSPLFTIG